MTKRHSLKSKPAKIADLLCKSFGLDELARRVDREMTAAAATATTSSGVYGRSKRRAVAQAIIPPAPAGAAEDVAELYEQTNLAYKNA